MAIKFSSHNIRLDNGVLTKPDDSVSMEADGRFLSARGILEKMFPGDRGHVRLADLGCLEGGYAVEFARMGFQVVGLEVREANIAACNYVKANTNLPNLEFVKDDAHNIAKYGVFDVMFCCGLFYHFDKPKQFLETLSSVTTDILILQTHFAPDAGNDGATTANYGLSEVAENEGLLGRWFTEFQNDEDFANREHAIWASWDNRRSFWIQREYLLQAIYDVGFDLVMEQYDTLGPNIAENMLSGAYKDHSRGTFIGVKTRKAVGNPALG